VASRREYSGWTGVRAGTGEVIVEGRDSRRSFDWERHDHILKPQLDCDDYVPLRRDYSTAFGPPCGAMGHHTGLQCFGYPLQNARCSGDDMDWVNFFLDDVAQICYRVKPPQKGLDASIQHGGSTI
jgi:hypothetical protein